MTDINSQVEGKQQPIVSMSTIEHLLEEEKQQMDKDSGPITVQQAKKEHKIEDLKNQFSHRILNKMDHDGDGKISQGELNAYIGRIKSKAGRYRCYCIISSILFLLVMFGIFSLGFEITRQFSIDTNKTSTQGTRKLTDRDGKELSTTTGFLDVDVSDFWNEDLDDGNKIVTFYKSNYNGVPINSEISRVEIIGNVTTLYDYTGNTWFEYYRNDFNYTFNDTGETVGGSWIMYQRDVVSGKISITPNVLYSYDPRRLQGKGHAPTPAPSPTTRRSR